MTIKLTLTQKDKLKLFQEFRDAFPRLKRIIEDAIDSGFLKNTYRVYVLADIMSTCCCEVRMTSFAPGIDEIVLVTLTTNSGDIQTGGYIVSHALRNVLGKDSQILDKLDRIFWEEWPKHFGNKMGPGPYAKTE